MSSLRIAAAQSVSIPGDIPANVAAHRDFIIEAAAYDVDIIVFPELSLCGYELPLIGACAVRPDDAVLAPLRELATSKGILVVVGAPIVSASNKAYIGTIMFFPEGEARIYRKQHLHPGEERFVTACAAPCGTYQVADESIALAICADTAHEQHPQAAAAAGASLYLASVLVSDAGYIADSGKLQHYAGRYGMATLMANHGGPTGGYVSAGKSAVWSQDGKLVVAAPGTGQYLVIASKNLAGWAGELRKIET
jgi:predicted amidohydrolase